MRTTGLLQAGPAVSSPGAKSRRRRGSRIIALAFIAAFAAGSGAVAQTGGPLDPVLCSPPDLGIGAVTSLLLTIEETVSSTNLACAPENKDDDPVDPLDRSTPKKTYTRPAAQTPTTARPASPPVTVAPPAKVGRASGPGATPQKEDIVSVPIAVIHAAKFPIVFAIGVIAGVIAMILLFRRRARRADAVERMKTELLSNISHELRTPLTPVRGYAEILRSRQVPPEKVRQYAEAILDAAEQLESVVNILVSFAAIEGGRVDLRRAPVEVAKILDELTEHWQRRAPSHVVTAQADGVPRVLLDGRLAKLAIDQLIDNAVKFSPGGGLVTVRAAVTDSTLEISVADQGVGIAPGGLETIFESFRQGDGSSTRRFGGLGLGLSLVARVAAVHDGEVRVSSAPGQGSIFTVAIPFRPARDVRVVTPRSRKPREPVAAR